MLSDQLNLTRTLIGLDLETTGRNPEKARIVEISLEIFRPGKPVKHWCQRLNPGVKIPAASAVVHHITDEDVQDKPTFDQIAENLIKGFSDADFCGQNVRFDLRVLAAEFRRARRDWDYEAARVLDSLRLWQIIEPRSLDDAVKYWIAGKLYSVKPELAQQYLDEIAEAGKSHSAGRDVIASTRVISAQLICSTLTRDLDALHKQCTPGWFDAEGKLQWMDGELCFAFGKHRDESIKRVPRDYLNFICRGTFSEKVKDVCRSAMRGIYPVAPATDYVEERTDNVE